MDNDFENFGSEIKVLERLSKRERLGELLIRHNKVSVSQLEELIKEQNFQENRFLGEILVKKNILTSKDLLSLLMIQKKQDKTIDNCFKKLGYMTNSEKWSKITKHEKVGEVLLKIGKIKLHNLFSAMDYQQDNPNVLLGEILINQNFIVKEDLEEALNLQKISMDLVMETIKELKNLTQVPIDVKINHMTSFFNKNFNFFKFN